MEINYLNSLITRTPVGSISELKNFESINNIDIDGLHFIVKTFDNYFKTALFYASKDLYLEISKSIEEKIVTDKVFYSYLKYYIRFCSRSTPFGLFSTYGICEIINSQNQNTIKLENSNPKFRISLSYIYQLCSKISESKSLWYYFFLIPNKTFYKVEGKIRYSEFYYSNSENNYRLSSIENNDVLDLILSSINDGMYFEDLSKLIEKIGYSEEDVKDYLVVLIENNLLLLDIFPSPASNNYVEDFLIKLSKIKDNSIEIIFENKSTTIVSIIDSISKFQNDINSLLKNDLTSSLLPIQKLVYENHKKIDLISLRNGSVNINSKIFQKITETIHYLTFLKVKSGRDFIDTALKKFIDDFQSNYGEAEIPLLFIIDPELGIFQDRNNTINTSLLEGIPLSQSVEETEYKFNDVDRFLLSKYQDALKFDKYEILITKDDCLQFTKTNYRRVSQSLSCNLDFYKDEDENVHFFFNGAYGSSAVNNMGRFTFASTELRNLAQEIVKKETENLQENLAYVEIVDLPNVKHGNLIVRENFINDELLINISSTFDKAKRTIKLQDINVTVKNDFIYLIDKVTNKVLIPRLSSAHNYQMSNLSHIYRFLSSLQTQWNSSIEFSWGFIETFAKFTPRVKINEVIVKEATWNFNNDDLKPLKSEKSNSTLTEFRKKWNIPTKVFLTEGDNRLFFDFGIEIFNNLFIYMISKKNSLVLNECIINEENAIVKDFEGKAYYSEFILPIHIKSDTGFFLTPSNDNLKTRFSPLSNCIYINVYTGEQQIDSFIKNELSSLNKELISTNLIHNFFFIRYFDKGYHLRIRFFLQNSPVYNDFFEHINYSFNKNIENNIIKSFEITTYHREIDRYKYLGIEFTEKFFGFESNMVINLLLMLERMEIEDRWLIGTIYIDKLLTKFDYSTNEKKEFFDKVSGQFDKEFQVNKNSRANILKQYRKYETSISEVILGTNNNYNIFHNYFDNFLTKISIDLTSSTYIDLEKNSYLGSLIHMFCNRLLISQHRKQELVIYHFMYKHYNTQLYKINN